MKYLFMIGLLLYSSLSYSQIYAYKAFECLGKQSSDMSTIKDDQWQKVNVGVVVNLDNAKIYAYGDSLYSVDLLKPVGLYTDHAGSHSIYLAMDNKGQICNVTFTRYNQRESQHKATLIFTYIDFSYAYRLKAGE